MIIQNEAIFLWGKKRLINKNKIDDVLCCIEAYFPEKYKTYTKQRGLRVLKSGKIYLELKKVIQNRFFASTSYYFVRAHEAIILIEALEKAIKSDIKFINEEQSSMF